LDLPQNQAPLFLVTIQHIFQLFCNIKSGNFSEKCKESALEAETLFLLQTGRQLRMRQKLSVPSFEQKQSGIC